MFSKSKGDKGKKKIGDRSGENREKPNLAQFGLLDISNVSNLGGGDDENDDDLEAELLALMGGDSRPSRPKKAKNIVDKNVLDKMVAECMNDDDGDDHVDENDPDLLAELSAIYSDDEDEEETISQSTDNAKSVSSPPILAPTSVINAPTIVRPSPFVAGHSVINVLNERIDMYKEAENNAIASGDTSRAKRFSRGLKNLNQMRKSAEQGKPIKEGDIPPPVLISRRNSAIDLIENSTDSAIGVPSASVPPTSVPHSRTPIGTLPDPMPPNNTASRSGLLSPTFPSPSTIQQNIIFKENEEVLPKSSSSFGEKEPSLSPFFVVQKRQTEYKLAALNAKKLGDKETAIRYMKIVKQMDPLILAAKENQPVDFDSLPPPPLAQNSAVPPRNNPTRPAPLAPMKLPDVSPGTSDTPVSLPSPAPLTPVGPASIQEALEQRLAKYTEQRDKAKTEENLRKERMNQRIMKQYQDAIRALKMGRAVDFSELPSPPGFPPLPSGGGSAVTSPTSQVTSPTERQELQPTPAKPKPAVAPKPQPPQVKTNVRKAPQSRVERQLSVLKKRQSEFKTAALEAKKRGEIEQAKEFLRNYKGIEQLIEASHSGLPVDMHTVPIPPQEQISMENSSLDFEVVEQEDCITAPPTADADVTVAFSKLEEDLISQIKMCARTREHFKALGDVASSNRFEQLILGTKKDLDAVRVAFKRGDKPPRFHYENRTFTVIQCNTELNDSDCEVSVVRGINFNVSNPSETDTFVKVEFPYPSDAPPVERTPVVKATNNPEFNHKVVFSIDRKLRTMPRVFKRHFVKCQVGTKGGWFHRDSVLGTAKVPLVSLENKCTLHESFDLVDDKKKMVGGKLEVKIRLRNPILTKQLEKVNEKWIVIDGF